MTLTYYAAIVRRDSVDQVRMSVRMSSRHFVAQSAAWNVGGFWISAAQEVLLNCYINCSNQLQSIKSYLSHPKCFGNWQFYSPLLPASPPMVVINPRTRPGPWSAMLGRWSTVSRWNAPFVTVLDIIEWWIQFIEKIKIKSWTKMESARNKNLNNQH